MAAAKHRAIDYFRRNALLNRKHEDLAREFAAKEMAVPDLNRALDDDVGDDLLRLIFVSCHPVLTTEARLALTPPPSGRPDHPGNSPPFLCQNPPSLNASSAPNHPRRKANPLRKSPAATNWHPLSSVLEVIYLIFNEGYSATAGDDWMRPALCEDALRLGRILAELAPREPEVHGLVALMEIQASRTAARVNSAGEPILILEQNRTL